MMELYDSLGCDQLVAAELPARFSKLLILELISSDGSAPDDGQGPFAPRKEDPDARTPLALDES
jgi:hypothetical protein